MQTARRQNMTLTARDWSIDKSHEPFHKLVLVNDDETVRICIEVNQLVILKIIMYLAFS